MMIRFLVRNSSQAGPQGRARASHQIRFGRSALPLELGPWNSCLHNLPGYQKEHL